MFHLATSFEKGLEHPHPPLCTQHTLEKKVCHMKGEVTKCVKKVYMVHTYLEDQK
jgi:hypothetical protein